MFIPLSTVEVEFNNFPFFDMIIPFIIFGVMFIIIFGAIIAAVVHKIKTNRIIKHGKKKMARYIQTFRGQTATRTVNDHVVSTKQYYGVEFEFRNDEGKLVRAKSTGNYILSDAEAFQKAGYFEVYVLGDSAVIESVPNTHNIQKYQQLKEIKTCMYCGSRVSKDSTKCEGCGSSQFEDMV